MCTTIYVFEQNQLDKTTMSSSDTGYVKKEGGKHTVANKRYKLYVTAQFHYNKGST